MVFPVFPVFPALRWNAEYWRLKREVVGVSVPVLRGGADLDPPTIFHIAQDYDMIRYFTRTILQFQFWARLCSLSGHRGPLHRCGSTIEFSSLDLSPDLENPGIPASFWLGSCQDIREYPFFSRLNNF